MLSGRFVHGVMMSTRSDIIVSPLILWYFSKTQPQYHGVWSNARASLPCVPNMMVSLPGDISTLRAVVRGQYQVPQNCLLGAGFPPTSQLAKNREDFTKLGVPQPLAVAWHPLSGFILCWLIHQQKWGTCKGLQPFHFPLYLVPPVISYISLPGRPHISIFSCFLCFFHSSTNLSFMCLPEFSALFLYYLFHL